ncbi:unnamed protein product [Oppiella nova]|uniref:Uncharacterized protein n=1 Tax=Oppiella nova TaxID=334625 RepID=A0A7R9L8J7_9ACAR|nr:unnamed protein product [Oppiella nova]CAG2159335.1 unnamed protein product [Oppiella nova]
MASSLINNYFLIINLLSIVMYSVANPINGDIIDTDVSNLDKNKLNVNLNEPQVYISDDHRIQRCKEMHPTYDYDHLSEDDQSELSDKIDLNPCRVDCVIYESSMDSTGAAFWPHMKFSRLICVALKREGIEERE